MSCVPDVFLSVSFIFEGADQCEDNSSDQGVDFWVGSAYRKRKGPGTAPIRSIHRNVSDLTRMLRDTFFPVR